MPPVRPAFVRPCVPTVTSQPPVGERWVHEAKWDGWRFQIIKAAGEVGAETDRDAFRSIVRKIATATSSTESTGKKAAKKRKAT